MNTEPSATSPKSALPQGSTPTSPSQNDIGILDQFQTDFVEAWHRLPNKALFFILAAAWVALFHFLGNSTFGYLKTASLFSWLYQIYTGWSAANDADRQGLWIPLVVLGLYWWKRKELLTKPLQMWWPALLLVVSGLVLHLVGYVIQQARVSTLGMLLGLYGLTGLAWGREWLRASLFPYFLLIFCIPFSPLVTKYTVPLQVLVCQIVEIICHTVLGVDVIRVGTQLFDPLGKYQYEVAAACSGIRSLIAIGTISTVAAFMFFRTWWRRILLLASAVPLAIIGNVIRLQLIILAAELWGREAGDYVHHGGPMGIISLLPYVPAFLGLMVVSKWLSEAPGPESAKTSPTNSPAAE